MLNVRIYMFERSFFWMYEVSRIICPTNSYYIIWFKMEYFFEFLPFLHSCHLEMNINLLPSKRSRLKILCSPHLVQRKTTVFHIHIWKTVVFLCTKCGEHNIFKRDFFENIVFTTFSAKKDNCFSYTHEGRRFTLYFIITWI